MKKFATDVSSKVDNATAAVKHKLAASLNKDQMDPVRAAGAKEGGVGRLLLLRFPY